MGSDISMHTAWNAEEPIASHSNYQYFFRQLFQHTPNGIAITDHKGKIEMANQAFVIRVLNDLSFADLAEFVPPANGEPGDLMDTVEIMLPTSSGVMKVNRTRLQGDAPFRGFLWMASEVPLQYEGYYSSLWKDLHQSFIDNALEFVFCTTANDTLLFANDPFIRHFGMPSCQHAIDQSAEVLFETPEDYRRLRDRVLEEQRVTAQTIHFKTADGGRMTGLVNCQCHKDENGMLILNWMVLDISHHVEFKTRLRSKNEELKEVNSKMEKFLYSTSHDLRSPLSSILGLVNLMRLETKDPEILDYIGKIEGSAVKLDRIVQDLRGFSNTSYKSRKIERIVLEDLTRKIIASYHGTDYFHQIHFEITAREHEPFFSDAECMEIILDNIIRNAIHFYDANKVRPFVRIAIVTDAKELQLEVMDNGIGIAKMHQNLIFDMFYKASHQSRGAGLGLYIVKESVQLLKGSVTVESEIGFGSIFRFRIPNNPGETKEEELTTYLY